MVKKERAVSPIIATLLLILVSVAAAAVLYVVVVGMVSGGKSSVISGASQQSQTQILIESARLEQKGSDTEAKVYVRNVGSASIPAGNWTVTLYHANWTFIATNLTQLNFELVPGNVTELVLNFTSIGVTSGKNYIIGVVSPSGSADYLSVRAK